ncbi:unnamed protein product, partial [Meganyctiphanes norvegica]
MDGDLSEGGMQTVALNENSIGTNNGESQSITGVNSQGSVNMAPTQPAAAGQPRPTSLQTQLNSSQGQSYSTPNSATSPEPNEALLDSTKPTPFWSTFMTTIMSPVSLTSPTSENGSAVVRSNSHSKMESIKTWSISTYKCTKQLISERLGKSSRTVDTELEGQIEALRDTQRKYSQILRLARALSSHFYHVVQTQQQLGEAFSDLAQ